MRALCGAIITAGALIGLGLSAIGIGLRYQLYPYHDVDGKAQWVLFKHLDTTLMVALIALLLSLIVGMGIAFVGLAYHHQRRHLELVREKNGGAGGHRVTA
jgi:ABC-type Fe3+ transport system permease subunit